MRKETVSELASGSNFKSSRTDFSGVQGAIKFKRSGIIRDAMLSNITSVSSDLTTLKESLKQLTSAA